MCPDGLWSLLLARPQEELGEYTLFCGHFYRHLSGYLDQSLKTFTFLRNPFDRALSHYNHIRNDHHHYFHERVQEQGSLLAFLEDPVTQPLVRNFQVRSLSATFKPFEIISTIENSYTQKYPLEQYLETADSEIDESKALLLAKDFLSRCIFVGIAERMQESAEKLAKMFDVSGNARVARLNTNLTPLSVDSLTCKEWSALADLLYSDWELYEFGLRIFQGYEYRGK